MRTLKKALSLVLVLAMVFALAVPGFAANTTKKASDFKDYSKVTNKEAVDVLTAIGVINGNTDGTFGPEGNFTRAQAASIVAHMVLGNGADALTKAATSFSDVPATHWASGYIQYCVGEGILNGYGNGKFGPDDTLTATQWALMLLGALGYKASNEGIGGNGWEVATTKLAIQAGVASADELTGTFNRDMAAKMAFKTLTATMVQYSSGTNVSTSDGTTITINATRSKVEHAVGSGYNMTAANNDQYTQFCEQYFSKLKLNNSNTDTLGRPCNKWISAGKAVGTYEKAATYTYTSDLSSTNGKKTVKADLNGCEYKASLESAGNVTAASIANSDAVAALTGNGRVVEVYITDNVVTNVVAIDSTLTSVKKITADAVTLANGKTISKSESLYAFASSLKAKDKVVVVMSGDTVMDAYQPTFVTGKFTKINNAQYTVGGTAYQAGKNANVNTTLKADNLLNTYTLTLDKYGYILAVGDEDVAESTYAYVLDASASVNRGNYDYAAKLLFTDGTTKWVDVSKVGGQSVADGKVTTATMMGLKADTNKGFVTYVEKDGKYELTAATTTDVTGSITKGQSTIFTNKTASNATIFLVENGTSYTVYTGIKNVPSMNVTNAKAFLDGSVAKIVVINKSATTSNTDQVFIYSATSTGTEKIDNAVVNYYKALVNGEDTTIGVMTKNAAGTTVNGDVGVGLFLNNSYTNGYISALGTKVVKDTASTSTVKVVAATAATDVTLKNGILTTDGTSYVVADELNAYLVKSYSTTASVDTLTLDSSNTFGANGTEGVTLASNDYVIVVLDSNGYVSNVFVADVTA